MQQPNPTLITLARPSFPKYNSRTFSIISFVIYANNKNKNRKDQKFLSTIFNKEKHISKKKENPRYSSPSKAPSKTEKIRKQKNLREHMIYCSFPNVIIQQIYKMERSLEPTEQDKIFHAHFSIFHLCHVESALR